MLSVEKVGKSVENCVYVRACVRDLSEVRVR